MKIKVPEMAAQQRFIFEVATKAGIEQLEKNLKAPMIEDLELDERDYDNSHMLPEDRWEAPHPDIVHAYIDQLKRHSDYQSDKDIVVWLGLKGRMQSVGYVLIVVVKLNHLTASGVKFWWRREEYRRRSSR